MVNCKGMYYNSTYFCMIAELIPLILLNFRDDDSGSDDYSKPVRSKSTISRRESDRSDGEEEMRGSKSKRDLDSRIRSTVVIKRSRDNSEDSDCPSWERGGTCRSKTTSGVGSHIFVLFCSSFQIQTNSKSKPKKNHNG